MPTCDSPLWVDSLHCTALQDNMALSFKTPAEDEIAVNVLTGGASKPWCVLAVLSLLAARHQLLLYKHHSWLPHSHPCL